MKSIVIGIVCRKGSTIKDNYFDLILQNLKRILIEIPKDITTFSPDIVYRIVQYYSCQSFTLFIKVIYAVIENEYPIFVNLCHSFVCSIINSPSFDYEVFRSIDFSSNTNQNNMFLTTFGVLFVQKFPIIINDFVSNIRDKCSINTLVAFLTKLHQKSIPFSLNGIRIHQEHFRNCSITEQLDLLNFWAVLGVDSDFETIYQMIPNYLSDPLTVQFSNMCKHLVIPNNAKKGIIISTTIEIISKHIYLIPIVCSIYSLISRNFEFFGFDFDQFYPFLCISGFRLSLISFPQLYIEYFTIFHSIIGFLPKINFIEQKNHYIVYQALSYSKKVLLYLQEDNCNMKSCLQRLLSDFSIIFVYLRNHSLDSIELLLQNYVEKSTQTTSAFKKALNDSITIVFPSFITVLMNNPAYEIPESIFSFCIDNLCNPNGNYTKLAISCLFSMKSRKSVVQKLIDKWSSLKGNQQERLVYILWDQIEVHHQLIFLCIKTISNSIHSYSKTSSFNSILLNIIDGIVNGNQEFALNLLFEEYYKISKIDNENANIQSSILLYTFLRDIKNFETTEKYFRKYMTEESFIKMLRIIPEDMLKTIFNIELLRFLDKNYNRLSQVSFMKIKKSQIYKNLLLSGDRELMIKLLSDCLILDENCVREHISSLPFFSISTDNIEKQNRIEPEIRIVRPFHHNFEGLTSWDYIDSSMMSYHDMNNSNSIYFPKCYYEVSIQHHDSKPDLKELIKNNHSFLLLENVISSFNQDIHNGLPICKNIN